MGQIVGLDATIFIYVWESNSEFAKKSLQILDGIENGDSRGVFSMVGLIELVAGAKKFGRFSSAVDYKEKIYNFPNLILANLNSNIVDISSTLRAKYSLQTPDAIHLATAIDAGADKFVTNDKALKRVKEMKIQLL